MNKLKDILGNELQFEAFEEKSLNLIKVNLIDSMDPDFISEGVWAVCSPQDKAIFNQLDSGRGNFVVALANHPLQLIGGYGLHLIANWQNEDRPIVDLAHMDLEGSDEIYWKES
jgi:hypothetical protein